MIESVHQKSEKEMTSSTLIQHLISNGWIQSSYYGYTKYIGDQKFEIVIDDINNEITVRCRDENIWQPTIIKNVDQLRESSKIDIIKNIIKLNRNIADAFIRDIKNGNIQQFLDFIPKDGIDPCLAKSHFENSFDIIEIFQTCIEREYIMLDSNGYIKVL